MYIYRNLENERITIISYYWSSFITSKIRNRNVRCWWSFWIMMFTFGCYWWRINWKSDELIRHYFTMIISTNLNKFFREGNQSFDSTYWSSSIKSIRRYANKILMIYIKKNIFSRIKKKNSTSKIIANSSRKRGREKKRRKEIICCREKVIECPWLDKNQTASTHTHTRKHIFTENFFFSIVYNLSISRKIT
jgi:hypothetical protein